MAKFYGNDISNLIEQFMKLPGIGSRSAQRIAFHLIKEPEEKVLALSEAIVNAKKNIHYCSVCCNFTDTDPCYLCSNYKRKTNVIMVVESPKDMAAYEKTNEFNGLYHILHGAISPLNGITPEDIKTKELLKRIQKSDEPIEEVILATNPNVEGEATAMYISRLLKPLNIKVTRIAHGVPIGGDLEHVDEITLSKALMFRREME